jgi:hypothetical protein
VPHIYAQRTTDREASGAASQISAKAKRNDGCTRPRENLGVRALRKRWTIARDESGLNGFTSKTEQRTTLLGLIHLMKRFSHG